MHSARSAVHCSREDREKPEQMPNKVKLHRSLTACMIRLAREKRMFASGFHAPFQPKARGKECHFALSLH